MTGRLHLRLHKYLMGDAVGRAAVASIRPLSADRKVREVIIPSGSAPPLLVDLDPGRYLVEAALPSGDLVSDEVEVVDGQDATLELRPDESPHEWLSWPQFLGRVEPFEKYYADHPDVQFQPEVSLLGDLVPLGAGEVWTALAQAAAPRSVTPPEPLAPFAVDPQAHLYQLTSQGAWNGSLLPRTPPPYSPNPPRRYLVVRSHGFTELVCLPIPWSSLSTENELPVQVVVRKPRGGDVDVAVTVRDSEIGAALGFMTSGALSTAERLFDQARHAVYRKHTNPLGAAGAGYVLLGTERGAEPKDWHDWISNMLNGFEWIPDGAIQHGWLKLRHRKSEADLRAARESLVVAYRRGLPFYSVGLQWLVDGLTMFAARDAEAAGMLENVRRVARRTNPREPFTTVRLPLS